MSWSNNGRPPKQTRKPTFVSRDSVRCPDCEYEGRLDALGLPMNIDPRPLRPSRVKGRRRRSSDGCATCYGRGRIPLRRQPKAGCKSNDPMEIPAKGK